jgi:transcriptional regulator with XRE-family HTH domain
LETENAFGAVLRAKRKYAGLSQEKLALEVGLERTFISMMERGLRQPTITTLLKLAPTLGCSAAELVAEVESRLHASTFRRD